MAKKYKPVSNLRSNHGGTSNFPPAFDMALLAGGVAIVGNVGRNRSKGKDGFSGGKEWVRLVGAIIALSIVLGFSDRGHLSQPVRAFAALVLLVAILYYAQFLFGKKIVLKKGASGSSSGKSSGASSGSRYPDHKTITQNRD